MPIRIVSFLRKRESTLPPHAESAKPAEAPPGDWFPADYRLLSTGNCSPTAEAAEVLNEQPTTGTCSFDRQRPINHGVTEATEETPSRLTNNDQSTTSNTPAIRDAQINLWHTETYGGSSRRCAGPYSTRIPGIHTDSCRVCHAHRGLCPSRAKA
jgi:hypothetical protein